MKRLDTLAALAALALFAGCATAPREPEEPAPTPAACPAGMPADAKCLRGRDSQGAHYIIAMPAQWNGVLVVHAHGGPALGEPKMERADEDAKRWAITVKAGYAWAASVFRQGGVAVTSAAEDTERVRRIFVRHVAAPRRTILHGQSWGASVAAKAAQMHAAPGAGKPAYDAVLLTNGVIAGAPAAYAFRLDLRVVYQYLCGNHPRPDEPQYPLWMGLPADSKLTRQELAARVESCLGLRKPAAQRTAEQARKAKTIAQVVRITEASIPAHLAWATWHFQDIATRRTGGLNPFGNEDVRYAGSDDDAALNAGVLRYRADPRALEVLTADTAPTGRIGVPVLSLHAIGDPTAFVELESSLRRAMEAAGNARSLVQVFTAHSEHSYLADPVYPTAFGALLDWVERGEKPAPETFARRCTAAEATFGPGCRVEPGYAVPPLATRVPARPGSGI